MNWSEKYKPKKFTELLFTNNTHFEALKWLKTWSTDSPILIISGPTGHSKTLLIRLICKLTNHRLVSLDSYSFKNDNYAYTSSVNSVLNQKILILLEEVEDSFYKDLLKERNKYKVPIVITCYDKYNPIFLNNIFMVLEVKKLTNTLVVTRINEILRKENIFFNQRELINLVEQSNCDLRSILNTLELFKRCRNTNVIKVRNSFQVINDILSHGIQNIEDISLPILSLVHTNYLESSEIEDISKISELYSLTNLLPSQYSFLPCTKLRCKKISFLPAKNKTCIFIKRKNHYTLCHNILPYYNLINSDSKEVKDDLQRINEKYKIYDNYERKEEKTIEVPVKTKERIFKMKFKSGRSFAVKRDVDINEFFA